MADYVVASADAFRMAVDRTVSALYDNAVSLIPALLGAIIILFIGWVFATILAHVFKKLLEFVKFEKMLAKYGVEDTLGNMKLQPVLIKLVKYYVILLFLQAAIGLFYLGSLSTFLMTVINYAPVFIGALFIIVVSAVIGEFAKEKILALGPKSNLAKFFGAFTKFAVVFLGVVTGLSTMGFDTTLVSTTFLTLLQGLVYGVALAIGIAFGFGGQDDAKAAIKASRERLHL